MTHILIPIGSLENLKTEFLSIPIGSNEREIMENLCKRDRILGKLELITIGKQISLSEESIETKGDNVPDACPSYDATEAAMWEIGWSSGYKQALKDLL